MTETPTAAATYEVPETVWDRVALGVTAQDSHTAAQGGGYEVTSLVERGVRIAVPLAVAAELRRLARSLAARINTKSAAGHMTMSDYHAYTDAIDQVYLRAAELDPPLDPPTKET